MNRRFIRECSQDPGLQMGKEGSRKLEKLTCNSVPVEGSANCAGNSGTGMALHTCSPLEQGPGLCTPASSSTGSGLPGDGDTAFNS